ncbi:MAG: hypothetical protein ACREAG_01295 [Nitrosopumilaceae archaeon]
MKTLHLSIIAIISIIIIGAISFIVILDARHTLPSIESESRGCLVVLHPHENNLVLKERTLISVSRIEANQTTQPCTYLNQDHLQKISTLLRKALSGADGCKDGTEVCQVSYGISSERSYGFGISVPDSQDYEQSLTPEDAKLLVNQLRLFSDGYIYYGTVIFDNKYYLVVLQTSDEDTSAQVETKFLEPIDYTPVSLQREESINYTLLVKTWATYGRPAAIDLWASSAARDSGLDVSFESGHLVIPERSETDSKLIIKADKNAKDGIYRIHVGGRINGEGLIGSNCVLYMVCPVIQIGNSNWQIETFGTDSNMAMGGKPPLKDIWAELKLNKEQFNKADIVEIRAYVINNSTKRIVLDTKELVIKVIKGTSVGYYDNLYGIRAVGYSENDKLVLEPNSTTLLARPFYWDQTTFHGFEEGKRLEPRKYNMMMSFGSYNGTVWHDDVWFEIK